MLKLNFLKFLSEFTNRQELANLKIKDWKSTHEDDYARFVQGIDRVADGDLDILIQMYSLLESCLPKMCKEFFAWQMELVTGKKKITAPDMKNCAWADENAKYIDQCIANEHVWLGINLQTGTIKQYDSPQPELLMINSGTPKTIWESMPKETQAYLIDLVNPLIDACRIKGISKQEYRQCMYKSIAFFAKLNVLVMATATPKFIRNLYASTSKEEAPLAYSMYYCVVFDHGLQKMIDLLNGILRNESPDMDGIMLINGCVSYLVKESMEMGVESKESWKKTMKHSEPTIWKNIAFALEHAKVKHGRTKRICSLDELLKGDKQALKQEIRSYLEENTDAADLAYLKYALEHADMIKASVSYTTFHRAIETFIGKKYGIDHPQKLIGEMNEFSRDNPLFAKSFPKAWSIDSQWTPRFKAVG